jgi:phospholipase/lecithinase/hemolysin
LSGDPDRACVDEQNWDAHVYNSKLQRLLAKLQGSLHGSRIVYVDAYRALMEILENPAKYGNAFC